MIFLTKGWLPYCAGRLKFRHDRPRTIEIAATGDFVGRGIWHLLRLEGWAMASGLGRLRAEAPRRMSQSSSAPQPVSHSA